MAASSLLLLSIIIVSIRPLSCFSIGNGLDITSLIRSTCSDDATTLPPVLLDTITSRQTTNRTRRSGGSDECDSLTCSITISSDFQRPTRGTCSETSGPISVQQYTRYTSSRHADCIDLFDRYESSIIRCEKISNTRTPQAHVEEFNIRWEASWISASSVWLFDLADAAGWQIEKQVPDSSRVSSFSWMSVGQVFQKAFQTGTIQLPVFVVEGNACLKIRKDDDVSPDVHVPVIISIKESIDLVREADLSRLQNRRVAQELASWLDVSRRPLQMDGEESVWAATVRERILTGVPGAGPLDVDPNEDGPGGFLIFGALCIAAFGLLYYVLLEEVVGGTGQVSNLCDDAVKLEVGSGYFSECFGPYGEGPFL